MSDQCHITSYCRIRDHQVIRNGDILCENSSADLDTITMQVYRQLGIKYSKFHKMDRLCKLGFISAEVLLKGRDLTADYSSERIGIVLANSASSLDTDRKHQESIRDPNNYQPSPSVFVYTLPNIMAGEISIRNGFKGENALFIFEEYETTFLQQYTDRLLAAGKMDACLTGWVDVDGPAYDAFVYLVEDGQKRQSQERYRVHDPSVIEQLYH